MTYTPKHLEWDEANPVDSFRVTILQDPSGPQLGTEVVPVGDPRFAVTGSHYVFNLTGPNLSPDNPSIPVGVAVHANVSAINGSDESPVVSSAAFGFSVAVAPVTNLHTS